MSSVLLSQNQRELVKFLKPYVLYTQSKKKEGRATQLLDSDYTIGAKLHPAEEALLDFKPDENEIDGKLYDEIVEFNIQPVRDSRNTVSQNNESSSDDSQGSSENEGFEIGGIRGFNTNMDDFLKNFGSISGKATDKINKTSRALSS